MAPNLPPTFADEPRRIASNTAKSVVGMQRAGYTNEEVLRFFGAEGGAGGVVGGVREGEERVGIPDGDAGGEGVARVAAPGLGEMGWAEESSRGVGGGAAHVLGAGEGGAEPAGGEEVGGVLEWEGEGAGAVPQREGGEEDGERGRKRRRCELSPRRWVLFAVLLICIQRRENIVAGRRLWCWGFWERVVVVQG